MTLARPYKPPRRRTLSRESVCCHYRRRLWTSRDSPPMPNCCRRVAPLEQPLVGGDHRRGGRPVPLGVARVSRATAQRRRIDCHLRRDMRRTMLLTAAGVVFTLPGLCGAQVDSASIGQVLATEDRRFAAMEHADTGALVNLLVPDLTYTHTDGVQNTRAELLQIVGSGALRYASIAPEAREVRVFASAAIVTGRSAMRVE